jgi:uncharacterized protein YcbX
MLGERLEEVEVTAAGLFGDRRYAVMDVATGRVASAKSPRKWGGLFRLRAALTAGPEESGGPAVCITLPDGGVVNSRQEEIERFLSRELGREVSLRGATAGGPGTTYEYDQSEEDRETVSEEVMPDGTFFDEAVVHLLTTATLSWLRHLYPQGDFDVRRFRPNVVIETDDGFDGFVEQAWIGRTLKVGHEVSLKVTGSCSRCVMVNLPQPGLPKDPGILKTVAGHNGGDTGVYARVLEGGRVRTGDRVSLG